ncbi:B12-binding domain-containing radical SAM protein [Allocoleopsis sp.]|uniref:B12-binding domain-containing radical SAM protein n=1 Tax=Allocoleopsis sp. TaxID=3088169 RepID=UPI002FD078B7
MKALLIWPVLPNSFWSFRETLDLAGLRASTPPLGLITVAALLPSTWEIQFIDRNVQFETDEDWAWCDLALLSAMIVQKEDFRSLIQKGVALGKKVAVGGPFPTSVPEFALEAGAHYLILDEGECTIPLFVNALERGEPRGIFRSAEKPDVTQTPIPRFDLLDLDAYITVTVQFSRGCPFQCEFCDITNLFGRKPRTKTPTQMLAELETLYQMGWRRAIFVVDDNFIGNKRNAKVFLRALIPWMEERQYPFAFITEASVNLAEDEELMELMVKAGFTLIFMGIETPDTEGLKEIHKEQNTRRSLLESCNKVTEKGLGITAGFIVGFDHESPGAGKRIQQFVEDASIPQPHLSLLQALHNTKLWTRLKQENRLNDNLQSFHQTAIMNFTPTRPVEEIVEEFIDAFWNLYEPLSYLKRTFRHFMKMQGYRPKAQRELSTGMLRLMLIVFWRQGIVRMTRLRFWVQLGAILLCKPSFFIEYFMTLCVGEHFFAYRKEVRAKLQTQLQELRS